VGRDLRRTLRGWRGFLCLVAVLAACAALLALAWPGERMGAGHGPRVAQGLLMLFGRVLLVASLVIVPGYAAMSIVSEREQETFEQLRLTLIRPYGIVLGKLANVVGLFLFVVVATMPMLACILFIPGLDWPQIAMVFVLVFATTLSAGAVGVFCSTLFRRAFLSLVASYIGLALIAGGPVYLFAVAQLALRRSLGIWAVRESMANLSAVISPFATIGVMAAGSSMGRSPLSAQLMVAGAIGIQLLWALVFVQLAAMLLRRSEPVVRVSTDKPIDDPAVLAERRRRYPYYLLDPLRRKPMIEDGRNPMLQRELRWGLFNRATTLVRVFYVTLAVSFLGSMSALIDMQSERLVAFWLATQTFCLVLVIPALASNTFTKEFELGNIDMIRATLLSPLQIVSGKALGGMITVAPLIVAALIGSIPMAFLDSESWRILAMGGAAMAVSCFVAASASICASFLSRRTFRALVLSYALVGISLLAAIPYTPWLFDGSGDLGAAMLVGSPVVSFLAVLDPPVTAGALLMWAGNLAVYATFGAALLGIACLWYFMMRTSD